MAAGNDDLTGEREIVADEDPGADYQAGGKRLIVAVAKPKHPGVILGMVTVGNLQEPEVALSVTAQRVLLANHSQVVTPESLLDFTQKCSVGDRVPGVGRRWRSDLRQLVTSYSLAATVNHQGCVHQYLRTGVDQLSVLSGLVMIGTGKVAAEKQ